jgi:hypothetical protein
MDKAEAEKVVKKYFGKWEKGDVPKFTYKDPVPATKNAVGLVDRSSSVQTVINIAQPIDLTLGDENYIASRLLSDIFGGGFSSRLFQNLREDKGYTYGANSSISADKLVGQFSAFASVRTEVTDSAVYEFIYEINNLVDNGITQEELDRARASMAGSFGRSLESPSTIANFALNTERYNLPKDYYATYLQRMNALTVEDINKTAKNLIDPDKLYITAVGNASEIKDKLAQFGEVTMYDNMGFPAKEMKMADANISAENVIENYLNAIGGKAAAQAVKTAKMTLEADVMGNPLSIAIVFDAENSAYGQKTSVMGNVMQATKIKDGAAEISAQGQSMQLTGAQLEEAMINAYLFPEAWYSEKGYTATLDGLKDVDGVAAYKVVFESAGGAKLVNYYSEETGLKIKNENPASGDTFFSDYQEKGGVLLPMMWTIKSAMIPVPLEAKVTNLEINPAITDADF